jgi:hypothetical protein
MDDPAAVTWSHATNSRAELDQVLSLGSKIDFIEADVLLPPHKHNDNDDADAEPIMACV